MPIILGRPFLSTANAIINCRNGVMRLTFGNMTMELNIFHLSNRDKLVEDKEQKSEEVCQSGTSEGRANNQELQKYLIENQEAVNEGSTVSPDILPASFMPPAPPDSIMPDNKERKLNSTAVHLTTIKEEPLLLDPP